MFNRVKRIIKLSKKDPKAIEALTDNQIRDLPDAGDGKAVFLGEGTHEEFLEQEKADKGIKGIFGL